jgi:hypothetical protein
MDSANQNLNSEESTFKENIPNKPELEKDLVKWIAPSRPFKRRDRQFYVTTISIAGMVCLILFLAEGAMPVILIISLIFLYYVMSTVPPEDIEYKITNKGIKVGGRLTEWENLGRFWFGKRFDSDLLIFETKTIPNRMELVFKSELKVEAEKTLKEYLVEEEISPSNLDKAIDWFSKKLPQ